MSLADSRAQFKYYFSTDGIGCSNRFQKLLATGQVRGRCPDLLRGSARRALRTAAPCAWAFTAGPPRGDQCPQHRLSLCALCTAAGHQAGQLPDRCVRCPAALWMCPVHAHHLLPPACRYARAAGLAPSPCRHPPPTLCRVFLLGAAALGALCALGLRRPRGGGPDSGVSAVSRRPGAGHRRAGQGLCRRAPQPGGAAVLHQGGLGGWATSALASSAWAAAMDALGGYGTAGVGRRCLLAGLALPPVPHPARTHHRPPTPPTHHHGAPPHPPPDSSPAGIRCCLRRWPSSCATRSPPWTPSRTASRTRTT